MNTSSSRPLLLATCLISFLLSASLASSAPDRDSTNEKSSQSNGAIQLPAKPINGPRGIGNALRIVGSAEPNKKFRIKIILKDQADTAELTRALRGLPRNQRRSVAGDAGPVTNVAGCRRARICLRRASGTLPEDHM